MSLATVPLQVDATAVAEALNFTWILVASFLIFFMHAGFAMLEAGQVRSKNVANQLTKNMLTWALGVVTFFLVGAGVSSLVGTGEFTWVAGADPSTWASGWLYGAVFAMTAATIVSGAVAGRAKLRAYASYTILLAAIIYPVVTGITWSGSLIADWVGVGFHDFAGGMIVHGMGGIAGLTAAWVLGPRLDRYNEDGSVNVIPGHSLTFAVLGTLILAFGWYGFNVGTAAIFTSGESGLLFNGAVLGRVALTTTLAMAMGAVGAGAMALARTGKVDTLYVANGLLAGLVAITAIPDTTTWWGALVIGLVAGGQLPLVFGLVERRLKIDDVCAVFPVHGSAGVLGALAYPFVAVSLPDGVSLGGAVLAQLTGVVVIAAWTVLATAAVFGVLKALGQARVTPEHERKGLDVSEHGVETYPEFSLGDEAVADGGRVLGAGGAGTEVRPDGGDRPDDACVRSRGGERE
ncbi:MAG: ammonium transporter [Haloarculaceae archaeon]